MSALLTAAGTFHLLIQAGSDHEQHRRLELRGHGLARIDLAVGDDAVVRRLDDGIVEIAVSRRGGLVCSIVALQTSTLALAVS